ncbi:50S ribosomal protein L17 [Rhodocaloribacter litoris]|uniref:50S ribosomal protein L17 n=1 Tax=Rhodocaloribacter litoris TaxID=2558931 RepID=UPI0023430BEE|nr:50S ribosomal protein L17 [Rhodocaloribacter litoris]
MRHQHKGFKLGRTHSHRKATLAALSNALIRHKRITTTVAKAKALRMYVEPLINRAKQDTTHNRRQVFRYLQDKHAVKELFGEIAERIGDRPGGYTRIVKLGRRAGDAAELAMIELVDYNDVKPAGAGGASRRRTRRGGGRRRRSRSTEAAPAAAAAEAATPSPAEPEVEDVTAAEAVEETPVETAGAEATPKAEAEAAAEPAEAEATPKAEAGEEAADTGHEAGPEEEKKEGE